MAPVCYFLHSVRLRELLFGQTIVADTNRNLYVGPTFIYLPTIIFVIFSLPWSTAAVYCWLVSNSVKTIFARLIPRKHMDL